MKKPLTVHDWLAIVFDAWLLVSAVIMVLMFMGVK